jgi:type IV pilus assembly protein PilX
MKPCRTERHPAGGAKQRGMVLIIAILLLLVVTLLAVAMFRGMGVDAKIAGNVREKQRAVHAALTAEQYAEFWLSSGANSATAPSACNSTANASLTATIVQVCSNIPYGPTALAQNTSLTAANAASNNTFVPVQVPWKISGTAVGYTYTPLDQNGNPMLVLNGGSVPAGQSAANYYAYSPGFYIAYLGASADGYGNVFQVDSYGYGGTADSVAVIESTYEVQNGVRNLGGP